MVEMDVPKTEKEEEEEGKIDGNNDGNSNNNNNNGNTSNRNNNENYSIMENVIAPPSNGSGPSFVDNSTSSANVIVTHAGETSNGLDVL